MPRNPKPPKLWYRKPRAPKPGRTAEKGVWIILHDGSQYSTGCGEGDRQGAERALAEYIISSHIIPGRRRRIEEIVVADVLHLYLQNVVPDLVTAKKAAGRIDRLLDWWGIMTLDQVTRDACRRFAAARGKGAARRELQDLQAAINHHHREGLHNEAVLVTLPPAGEARQRWLSRAEVAKLIRICLHAPEIQNGAPTERRPLRHLARFILFALYTGSRPGDVFSASFVAAPNRSVIDLDDGLFYRKPAGKAATKKRQPTTPLPRRLMVHLRRWKSLGADYVVEFEGKPVRSIKTAFQSLIALSGLAPGIVPYTLRHTCATWKMRGGARAWEVGGFIGTSEAMIIKHYGHHHPDHLRAVADAATQSSPNKRD